MDATNRIAMFMPIIKYDIQSWELEFELFQCAIYISCWEAKLKKNPRKNASGVQKSKFDFTVG